MFLWKSSKIFNVTKQCLLWYIHILCCEEWCERCTVIRLLKLLLMEAQSFSRNPVKAPSHVTKRCLLWYTHSLLWTRRQYLTYFYMNSSCICTCVYIHDECSPHPCVNSVRCTPLALKTCDWHRYSSGSIQEDWSNDGCVVDAARSLTPPTKLTLFCLPLRSPRISNFSPCTNPRSAPDSLAVRAM